jgi:hypothetical protein
MQILLRWLDRKQAFRNTASGNPKLALGLLHQILCLLKFVGDRVKGPLAIMLDVNLVAAHGFDYDAGLFHGRQLCPAIRPFSSLGQIQITPPTSQASMKPHRAKAA